LTTLELAQHPARVSTVRAHAWIAGWFIAGRALIAVSAVCVHAFGPSGWTRHAEKAHALGVLTAWDGRWYRIVATSGYLLVPGRQSDPAFFPLFPILLRTGHKLGLGYSTAGLLIANVSFLVALVAFYRLSHELFDDGLARRATIYLALFPFGYVFSMVYPESLVLALVALAALAGLRGHWWLAAGCAAAATLARPEGAFVALPLLAIAWRQRRELTPVGRGLAAAAVASPAVALASFSLYLSRVVGDPLAWSKAQRAWGRHFTPLGVWHAFADLGHDYGKSAWAVRDVVAVVLYLVLLAAAARARVPWPWLIGGVAIVVLPLFSGSFDSVGRFGLLAPAAFWGLAAIGRDRRLHRLILAVSPPLLVAAIVTLPLTFP
jgi:Dolichyl-phosphate-mannose-protein mannosyltransferase